MTNAEIATDVVLDWCCEDNAETHSQLERRITAALDAKDAHMKTLREALEE